MGENFSNFIFQEGNNLAKSIDRIKNFEFILKKDKFSGLINLK